MTGRWDYLLTIGKDDRGFDNAVEAFTHLMNDDSPIRYSYDSMAYYMVNYKEFVEANKEGVMRHYFRHDADNEFTVWTIKSPKRNHGRDIILTHMHTQCVNYMKVGGVMNTNSVIGVTMRNTVLCT